MQRPPSPRLRLGDAGMFAFPDVIEDSATSWCLWRSRRRLNTKRITKCATAMLR